MTAEETRTYSVVGMTCDHCVASVRDEAAQVPGIQRVAVDLGAGRLYVSGEGFADEAVRAAVDQAGYELVP